MPANLNDKYIPAYDNPYQFYTPIMDYSRAKVHLGEMFFSTPYAEDVANAASLDIVITSGAKEMHAVSETSAGGQALLIAYSAPTVTAATGTAQAIKNRKQSSANTALASILINPTITATGSELYRRFIPGGTGGGKSGSATTPGSEIIIPASSTWLVRITNTSGNAADIGYIIEFYEE